MAPALFRTYLGSSKRSSPDSPSFVIGRVSSSLYPTSQRMTLPLLRVLLVEDNEILAESIVFALRTFGLEVVGPFASNDLADCEVSKENIGVGVLDVELDGVDSIPTATRLREAGIPFLFMSGHDMEEELPEEFQNELCLPKPITPEVLVEMIRELHEGGASS